MGRAHLTRHVAAGTVEIGGNGDAPDWIQVMPSGLISARDGREFVARDLQAIIRRTNIGDGVETVIDYDHQTEFAEANGQPAIAAGWVKEWAARNDGIWARVQWIERAAKLIASKEYRYISPTFLASPETGEVFKIKSAGVTNTPAFAMTALAKSAIKETVMDLPTQIVEALGLKPEATIAHALEAITALKKAAEIRDTHNAHVTQAMQQVASERKAIREERHKAAVDKAVEMGVFPPAMKDWAMTYIAQDEDGFNQYLRNFGTPYRHLFGDSPEKKELHSHFATLKAERNGKPSDDVERRKLAEQLGLNPSDLD
ncbi:MAG: phage protease [Pseudomonadota bacterium]